MDEKEEPSDYYGWRTLVKKLGANSAVGIILQQIQYLDTLSIIRVMKLYPDLHNLLQAHATIWLPRIKRLENEINKSINPLHHRLVAGRWTDSTGKTVLMTNVWNSFTFNNAYMMFLSSWARYGHVWKDKETGKFIEAQDWTMEVKFPEDWTPKDRALFFRSHYVDNILFPYMATWDPDTKQFTGLRIVNKDQVLENGVCVDCPAFERLIRAKVRQIDTAIVQISLRAVPTFVFRWGETGMVDVVPVLMRYGRGYLRFDRKPTPLFAVPVNRPGERERLLVFDGTEFKPYSKPFIGHTTPRLHEGWSSERQIMIVPCTQKHIPTDFHISLFTLTIVWEIHHFPSFSVTWRPISDLKAFTGEEPNFIPVDREAWQRRGITGFFVFRPKRVVAHETTKGALSIEARVCANCNLPGPLVKCGNACDIAYYCNQECADSHYEQHACPKTQMK